VDDLSMGSAHGAQSVAVDQEFADLRVDGAFVLAFVFDDVFGVWRFDELFFDRRFR
jgi:hypothetical protein